LHISNVHVAIEKSRNKNMGTKILHLKRLAKGYLTMTLFTADGGGKCKKSVSNLRRYMQEYYSKFLTQSVHLLDHSVYNAISGSSVVTIVAILFVAHYSLNNNHKPHNHL